ncbi:hypothetical protein B1H18_26765 [Streptomyces tsukubensis]|uniref:Uncharacterized protein n=1 Tax=Streptomyces tsukubensis TaxID=83656 RepID=A0A1V4A383_9ACTN|nr:hypothetical protein B1H18_26765 [Streptomyces tsukubensis]
MLRVEVYSGLVAGSGGGVRECGEYLFRHLSAESWQPPRGPGRGFAYGVHRVQSLMPESAGVRQGSDGEAVECGAYPRLVERGPGHHHGLGGAEVVRTDPRGALSQLVRLPYDRTARTAVPRPHCRHSPGAEPREGHQQPRQHQDIADVDECADRTLVLVQGVQVTLVGALREHPAAVPAVAGVRVVAWGFEEGVAVGVALVGALAVTRPGQADARPGCRSGVATLGGKVEPLVRRKVDPLACSTRKTPRLSRSTVPPCSANGTWPPSGVGSG